MMDSKILGGQDEKSGYRFSYYESTGSLFSLVDYKDSWEIMNSLFVRNARCNIDNHSVIYDTSAVSEDHRIELSVEDNYRLHDLVNSTDNVISYFNYSTFNYIKFRHTSQGTLKCQYVTSTLTLLLNHENISQLYTFQKYKPIDFYTITRNLILKFSSPRYITSDILSNYTEFKIFLCNVNYLWRYFESIISSTVRLKKLKTYGISNDLVLVDSPFTEDGLLVTPFDDTGYIRLEDIPIIKDGNVYNLAFSPDNNYHETGNNFLNSTGQFHIRSKHLLFKGFNSEKKDLLTLPIACIDIEQISHLFFGDEGFTKIYAPNCKLYINGELYGVIKMVTLSCMFSDIFGSSCVLFKHSIYNNENGGVSFNISKDNLNFKL